MELISTIASMALGLLISAVALITKIMKSEKAKRIAEYILKMRNILVPLIEKAETFENFTGEQKCTYVMEEIFSFASKNGIPLTDEFGETIKDKIDELVAMTKKVNIASKT